MVESELNSKIDEFEYMVQDCEPIVCGVTHDFADGMYIREIFMPKGEDGKVNFVTSCIHGTKHPFCVLEGKVAVISENDGEQILSAGYRGMTKPNTRRVLRIIESCRWVTFHATNVKPKDDTKEAIAAAVKLIEEQILIPYENKLLGGHFKNNVFIESNNILK